MADRALVLDTGKALYRRARDELGDAFRTIELRVGEHVPAFAASPEALAAVDAVMARTPFTHVVATSESHMAFAGFLRTRYGLPGLDAETAVVATNKWRMKRAVAPVLPTADGWLSGEFLERRGPLPAEVVVKPLSSSSARGVRRMPAEAARRALAASGELLLVEEALDVREELHCDGVVRGGALAWAIVSGYDRPALGATGTRASVHLPPDDPRVADAQAAVGRMVPALPARDCVFHLELLDVGGDLVFGEVGLRPAGTGIPESIRRCFGADVWLEFVAGQAGIATPLRTPVRTHDALSGVVMARPTGATQPLDAEAAARLPAVTGVGPGNLEPGETPGHVCAYHYLAFFDGLDAAGLGTLMEQVAATGVRAPA